jgi:hypothetical protein
MSATEEQIGPVHLPTRETLRRDQLELEKRRIHAEAEQKFNDQLDAQSRLLANASVLNELAENSGAILEIVGVFDDHSSQIEEIMNNWCDVYSTYSDGIEVDMDDIAYQMSNSYEFVTSDDVNDIVDEKVSEIDLDDWEVLTNDNFDPTSWELVKDDEFDGLAARVVKLEEGGLPAPVPADPIALKQVVDHFEVFIEHAANLFEGMRASMRDLKARIEPQNEPV